MPLRVHTKFYPWTGSAENRTHMISDSAHATWMLGQFQFRAYQYLHVELNEPYNSGWMNYFEMQGYLYGSGVGFGAYGYYPYGSSGGPINQKYATINNSGANTGSGAAPRCDYIWVTGNNKVWLRFNRGSTGYTEGQIDITYSAHGNITTYGWTVSQWTLNNSSSCPW